MKSPQQLSQEIIDIIKATGNYFVGNTSGMSNDGTVNVYHPKGYSVSAIAANPISSGEVIVFNVNGTWYAFGEQRTVVKEDILVLRKSRARDEENSVKTIFGIYNSNNNVTTFYLGGDRTSQKLATVMESRFVTRFVAAGVTNGKNSYSLIQLNNDFDQTFSEYPVAYLVNKNNKQIVLNTTNDDIGWQKFKLGSYWQSEIYIDIFGDIETWDFYKTNYFIKQDKVFYLDNKFTLVLEEQEDQFLPEVYDSVFKYQNRNAYIDILRKDESTSRCTLTNEILVSETYTTYPTGIVITYATKYRPYWNSTSTLPINYSISGNTITRNYQLGAGYDYVDNNGDEQFFELNTGSLSQSELVQDYSTLFRPTTSDDEAGQRVYLTENLFNNLTIPAAITPDKLVISYYSPSFLSGVRLTVAIAENPYGRKIGSNSFNSTFIIEEGRRKTVYSYAGRKNFVDFVVNNGYEWDDEDVKTTFTIPDSSFLKDYTSLYFPISPALQQLKSFKTKHTISGTAVVMMSEDTEVFQEYVAEIQYTDNQDIREDEYYLAKYKVESERTLIMKDITNIIKMKRQDVTITLNNSDFGIINCDNELVSVSLINKDTTAFTITINYVANKYIKNLIVLEVSGIDTITRGEFDPSNFTGNFLMSKVIDGKEALIKGEIDPSNEATYDADTGSFVVNCLITSIKLNTPTSFPNFFLLDNGSFYNYYFRKNIPIKELPYNTESANLPWFPYNIETTGYVDFDLFLNKSLLPVIPLNLAFISLFNASERTNFYYERKYFGSDGFLLNYEINNRTDNIVKNKIYSVVKVEKSKAWIERWDIKENGDVKYSKVFQVDYVPIKKANVDETLTIYGHSYYPK